jgi:pyruvate ferredoxin oxidoreductase alpha subunit
VVAAYPITPQTHIVEHLSEMVADGHLDAEFIPVESEHSAMSACVGAAAGGARTFTSTSAQGYALMIEICYIASSMRLPIVMMVANRALSAPISIWCDHSDMMLGRDIGWIQTVAENGQEAVDLLLHAFKTAEDQRVLLPAIVHIDGFILTHMIEPILLPEKDEVKKYLPVYEPKMWLDPQNPVTMGPVGMPEVYTEAKKAQEEALKGSYPVILENWQKFGDQFGRYYNPVETYRTEDADTILFTMGSVSETATRAVDRLREEGRSVGLVRLRLFRPFPFDALFDALKGAKRIAVLDRALAYTGGAGPICTEIKATLFERGVYPYVYSFISGLGGRDITVDSFAEMVEGVIASHESGEPMGVKMIDVRE